MTMNVTILGSNGSYPGPSGACSGFLVQSNQVKIWLDAGPGTLSNLQNLISMSELNAIIISHKHADHSSDLQGFAVANSVVDPIEEPIAIYAPDGVGDDLEPGTDKCLIWNRVHDNDQIEIGDLSIKFSRTDHGPETLALRIDHEGKSFVYSSDTGPNWSLSKLGFGIDLAICEATYLKDKEGQGRHLSARQAAISAKQAGVRQLVLSHLWPTIDPNVALEEAKAEFGQNVSVAKMKENYHI